MFTYRLTAPLLPALLLLFLPALAAYPWQLPVETGLVLPFLTLLVILFCALRYPGLLFSPLVFLSGLACDLFTRSPLGYWTLLFLLTLACARTAASLVTRRGPFFGWLCSGLTLILAAAAAWGLASLYQFEWQPVDKIRNGLFFALLLLPVPALLLTGMEHWLILPAERNGLKRYRSGK